MPQKLFLVGVLLLLAGCTSFPSGAGVEREVLAKSTEVVPGTATADSPGIPSEFAVEPITRDDVDRYAGWPQVGQVDLGWVGRSTNAGGRVIAPGDEVEVMIWNTENNGLLTEAGERTAKLPPMQVSPDGTIFLPYVGALAIGGLSPEAARAKVETAYATVVPSSQAVLTLKEGRESAVTAVSGVASPGIFPLHDRNMTLLEMLALAGGAKSGLSNPQMRLQRGNHTYGISMDRLLSDTALNTTMQGGDRFYVEDDSRYFLSLGAATKETQVPFPQDHVTALDALSLIGGLTDDRADAKGIMVLRRYPQSAVRSDGSGPRHVRTIFTISLDTADGLFSAGQFQINPGDLVYVSESPMINATRSIAVIAAAFGIANQVNNISNSN